MSTQWLTIQSFQHTQGLLTAINTLSIHIKLGLAGVPNDKQVVAAERAKEMLAVFLKEFGIIVKEVEQGETKPVLGANARVRQLAKSFVEAKRDRSHYRSALFRSTIPYVQGLLYSEKKEDKRVLIECLAELRMLLEEHMHTDTIRILGEI